MKNTCSLVSIAILMTILSSCNVDVNTNSKVEVVVKHEDSKKEVPPPAPSEIGTNENTEGNYYGGHGGDATGDITPPADDGASTDGITAGAIEIGTSGPTTKTGYENCILSTEYYGGTMGYFGFCKHDSDERGFKMKFAIKAGPLGNGSCTSTNCGACAIPMHLSNSGGSFALGPAQCVHHEANKEYFGTFQKARNNVINSVMVIHRYSVDSFFQCMGAYDQYMSQCGGHPACNSAAQEYANQVCQSFVTNHGRNYKQIHLNGY